MTRLPRIVAPLLAVVALMAWALSSPVGSSPDDDFHLVSIWCADQAEGVCEPGEDAASRVVPEALTNSPCFAFDPELSAACQSAIDYTKEASELTQRGNFVGGYPPVYYSVMNVFVGDNVAVSAVLMRVVNIVIFVGLLSALYWLLPVERRSTLVWSWVITTVPLGLFILSSNNPSAWAITGIGAGWIALLGFFESEGWRKVTVGALFVLSALMAAGSRGDAAIYMVLAIAAVLILKAQRTREFARDAILPLVVSLACFALFRLSRPVEALTEGLPGGGGGEVDPDETGIFGIIAYNLLEVPSLWTGIFGNEWGLGWLDTSMPAVVWLGGIACFIGVGFAAARHLDRRKLVVLVLGVLALWLLPTVVLVAAEASVGENMQPRYLLPLIVLFAGVLMYAPPTQRIQFSRVQVAMVAATLSVTNLIALHLNIRRYVTGFDDLGANLDAGIEWWWDIPFSPMFVWIIGSAAFAGLLAMVLTNRTTKPAVLPTSAAL